MDALAALRCEQRHHVIAGRQRRDVRPDSLDDACPLVPEHARRVPGGIRARRRVEVGVTDAAGVHAHERLTRPGRVELDVLYDERSTELLEHRGSDLHRASCNVDGTEPIRSAPVGALYNVSAIFSAIATVVTFVLARGIVGITDASATISPSRPSTRPSWSTTVPIAHVPAGWK